MRKLLTLALLLYNFFTSSISLGLYDYDDIDGNKRHNLIEDRRNWRKKALDEHKDLDRWRHEYDNHRYSDDHESRTYNGMERRDRERDVELSLPYRGGVDHHYDIENTIQQNMKSAERDGHHFAEKEVDKKLLMNCNRPHERFETCFAGCASVTCDNPRDRLRPCYPFCESGCICIQPYVRDDRTHKCVLPEECSKGLKGIPDLGEDV